MREMIDTLGDYGTPWLYGYSPQVLPKPPDWADNLHVTGYWFLDAQPNWQPPAELLRFLESGPPPVYVGFGSMSDKDPERLTRLVLRALELTGQRGVLLTGWGAGGPSAHLCERVLRRRCAAQLAVPPHGGGRASWRCRHHRRGSACRGAEPHHSLSIGPICLG